MASLMDYFDLNKRAEKGHEAEKERQKEFDAKLRARKAEQPKGSQY